MGFFTLSIIGIITGGLLYALFRLYFESKVSNPKNLYRLYNIVALIFGLIALATSWIWAYLFNMFTALPALLLGFMFVQRSKMFASSKAQFHKLNYIVLITSVLTSIAMLIAMQYK